MKDSEESKIQNEIEQVLDFFKKSHLFSTLNSGSVNALLPFCNYLCLDPKSTIIAEGDINRSLYFLVEGELVVYVKGEQVASITQAGTIIGEMSIISEKPTSATIKTQTRTKMISIDTEGFSNLPKNLKGELDQSLYKIFSVMLSEKLSHTNEKARKFEQANRDLLIAQEETQNINKRLETMVAERTLHLTEKTTELERKNAELTVSNKKMEEVENSRKSLVNLVQKIDSQTIKSVAESIDGNSEEKNKLRKDLTLFSNLLTPIKKMVAQEESLDKKKVLLIDHDGKQQLIAKLALGGTGIALECVNTIEGAAGLLEKKSFDLIYLGPEHIKVLEHFPQIKAVLVVSSDTSISSYIQLLNVHSQITHIVLRNDSDRIFTIKNILTTTSKIISKDIFGLEKYLNWGINIKEHPVENSKSRRALIESMDSYLKNLGVRGNVRKHCASVAEELLMNAIYDAPTDAKGKSIFNHLPRTVEVSLKTDQQGLFRYGCDGVLVALSVSDPFGALSRDLILKYLNACYQGNGLDTHSDGVKGGAGHGIYLTIRASDLVVYNIHKNIRTEVIALFNVDLKTSKKFKHSAFHMFIDS